MSAKREQPARLVQQGYAPRIWRALESMACAGLAVQRLADLCSDESVELLVLAWERAYGQGDLHGCNLALEELGRYLDRS